MTPPFYHRRLRKLLTTGTAAFAFAVTSSPTLHAEVVGEWSFDNPANLSEALIGNDLIPTGAIEPGPAGIMPDDGTVAIDVGEHFGVDHTIGANGGGAFTNEYTLIFDVSYPATSVGSWMCFYQTNSGNSNDGDLFVRNSDGAIGVGDLTYSTNTTVPDTWYRVVLSHDLGDGTSNIYVDGQEWVNSGTEALDGRFSLDHALNPDFYLFADENGDDATIYVTHVALLDTPVDAAAALALGQAGDAIVAPTKFCPTGLSCETGGDPIILALLTWEPGRGLDSTATEILRDGIVIATLPADASSYDDAPPLPIGVFLAEFEYTVRLVGGSDSANCDPLTCNASIWLGELVEELVLHLELEGDAFDSSGNDNHGTISGSPTFPAGRIGDSIGLIDPATPHQYVDLGVKDDLDFGADTDFSVSVWVNNSTGFPNNTGIGGSNDDPAIISNKDWNSGGNVGWVISAGGNGRWQWNIGDGAARQDYDGPANEIDDGVWHHLVVTHNRDGNAVFYYDGQAVATRDISGIGSISSGLPTAVGTDGLLGNGAWPNWFPGMIDDVLVWRRVITNEEVATLYSDGLEGITPGQQSLGITEFTTNEAAAEASFTFTSRGGRTYAIDTSTDLLLWIEAEDGIESMGATTTKTLAGVDFGSAPRYFRIVER